MANRKWKPGEYCHRWGDAQDLFRVISVRSDGMVMTDGGAAQPSQIHRPNVHEMRQLKRRLEREVALINEYLETVK